MISAIYGKYAVSHAMCEKWYQEFRQRDFSFEDELCAGRPQKKRTNYKHINSAQIEKELAEQLGITQQAISIRNIYVYIRWETFRRKADRFRINCPKTTKIDGVTLQSLCIQSSGKKIFCIKLLQAMKSGLFMITLNAENHGLTLVNLRHRRPSPISTPRRYLMGLERCILLPVTTG